MQDAELREEAVKRLKEKRDFKQHLLIYLLVNLFLNGIWFMSGGYYWPIWPMFGWGIGIIAHAFDVYGTKSPTEDDIQREMKHLAKSA